MDHRSLAGEVELACRVDPAADRVVQLLGVDPEMDPAHAEPVGAHRRRERLERHRPPAFDISRLGFEPLDPRRKAEALVRIIGGQPVGRGRQRGGLGQVGGEVGRAFRGIIGRRAQIAEQRVRAVDRFERGDITRKAFGLLRQAEADRIVPRDVGPPVHVVADPGREAERQRGEVVPFARPALVRDFEQPGDEPVARVLRVGDRPHRLAMLVGEGDRRALGRGDAGAAVAAARLCRHRGRFFRREQEGRMRGEHGVELRDFPAGAEGGEVLLPRAGLERREVGLRLDRLDQRAQVRRAAFERAALEIGDQPLARVERQRAALDLARQVERELEHRIEQRGFLGALVQRLEAGEQGLYRVHGTCWRMNAATAP